MAQEINRQWLLESRPKGLPKAENFAFKETPLPTAGEGEVLCRTLYLSLDPYMRGRMSDAASYAASVPLGGVMEGESVAQVIASRHPDFKPGDFVAGRGGWQSHWARPGGALRKVPAEPFPLSYHLGLMGMPGLTAYMGLSRIGKPKQGETVAVAAASGAVGMMVGQIAQRLGCRAVGIAGSDEKCRYVVEELGFDAAVNHRDPHMAAELAEACPQGIDVYFENVGGKVFEAVFPLLNNFARVPLCGLIAYYNATSAQDVAGNLGLSRFIQKMLVKRLHVEGFIVLDYWAETFGDFSRDMAKWTAEKPFKYREDVTEGLENAPEAFIGLFAGDNFGKALVKVAEPA